MSSVIGRANKQRSRSTRAGVLVAVVSVFLVLAGCGSGPSQVGAAAIVGEHRIPVDQVQQRLDQALASEPAAKQLAANHKLDLVGRELVGQQVVHELLARAAEQEGLTPDAKQVSDLVAQNPFSDPLPTDGSVPPEQLSQQLAFRARDLPEVVTDQVLLAQLGNKYLSKLAVTIDYTTVVSSDPTGQQGSLRDEAMAKAQRFAQGPAAAEKLIRDDGMAGVEASMGERLPAAQAPRLAAMVLFGVPENTVVAFQPSPRQEAWIIALVTGREDQNPQPVDQASQPSQQELVAVGQRLLQPVAEQTGVRISPRYGVWDPTAMDVAPSAEETSGIVLPVRSSPQP